MCGIAGCLALALEADPDQDWVTVAAERMGHRGPDDEGFYNDPDVILAFKRLAIIDLSPGGHQPKQSADGRFWMVFNGEIYNYIELGAELREQGVVLRTTSDSEVLLETYARVGKDVVHRLRGMYAFAIWDTWTRELFCARDPFGIKPFYYRIDRGPAPAEAVPAAPAVPFYAEIPPLPRRQPKRPTEPGGAGMPGADGGGLFEPSAGGEAAGADGAGGVFGPAGSGVAGAGGAGGVFGPAGSGAAGAGAAGGVFGRSAGGEMAGGGLFERPAGDGAAGAGAAGGLFERPSGGGGLIERPAADGAAGGGSRGGRHAAPVSGAEEPAAGDGPAPDWFDSSPTGRRGRHAASPAPENGETTAVGAWDAAVAAGAWDTPGPAGTGISATGTSATGTSATGTSATGVADTGTPGAGPASAVPSGMEPLGMEPSGMGPSSQGPSGVPHAGSVNGTAAPSVMSHETGVSATAAGPDTAGADEGEPWLLRFASERKCLAAPGELRGLDTGALRRYLSFQYVPAPATMTPPIQVLPPGHAMIARPGGGVDVYRYWQADLRPARTPNTGTPAAILAAMRDSIAFHLRSDAPLGAFLSGGIDSAAICALAAEHRPDLLTFTVGFEREGYSEIDRAQETAAAIGVKSIPYVISPDEFFHFLPRIIWHLDDPMADAAAIPLWFVAREASKQVKVVLSGEGSDELFGGYAIYHQPGVVRAGERMPDWGRMPIRRAAALIPAGVKGKGLLERTSTPLRRRYIGNAHVFGADQISAIAGIGPAGPWDVTDPVYDQAERAELDDVSTMQLVDINTWLAGDILVKADRMTMAHSLELRVPFLDARVMGVAAQLAREEKIGSGTTKLALRTAMSEVLPKAAAERAKLGFPVPIGHWLKGEAYGFADQLLRNAQTDQWINREAAVGLLERYRTGDHDVTWRHLWVLIVFSLWHQVFVERVYDPVALGWERTAGIAR